MKTLTFSNPTTAIKITKEQAVFLGIIDTKADEVRGDLKTYGVWQIPVSYKALCTSNKRGFIAPNDYFEEVTEVTFYGLRTMTNVKQGGYTLDGYVSIGGKKYSCFTSSQLFDIDGHLIDVATIHARIK